MFRVVGQLLVSKGVVVDSNAFKNLQYLGKFATAVESLISLCPDEISIIDLDGDITQTIEKNFSAINQINLPLAVGGGIDFKKLHYYPVERVILNSYLFDTFESNELDITLGLQAKLGYLPFKFRGNSLLVFNSSLSDFIEINHDRIEYFLTKVQELIFLDAEHQGRVNKDHSRIVNYLGNDLVKKSYFSGGIDRQAIEYFRNKGCAGVILDNTSLYFNKFIYER